MKIDLEVSGEQIVSRELLRTSRRARNAQPALREVGVLLEELTERNFATEGASGGKPWAPLAESTVRQKAAAGQSGGTLVATGDLLDSLTGGAGHIRETGLNFLIFGTGVEYAGYHQKGKGVPQRKPLQVTELHKRLAVKIIQRWVVKGTVGRSG